VASTVTGIEDTPYVFSWSDFHVSDVDSTSLSVWFDSLPSWGSIEFYDGTQWVAMPQWTPISKAEIDAGHVRFVPCENESGFPGYGGAAVGNGGYHYSQFSYGAWDGSLDSSDVITMTVDVTPVADAPVIEFIGTGSTFPTEIFTTGWETVSNPDTSATAVAQSTLEGWTLVTGTDGNAGGTNVFEIWSHNDNQTNAGGTTKQIKRATGGGNNWIELNDSSGTASQTLGIQRTVTTIAGAQYSLSMQYAAEMGFSSAYGVIAVYVDGVLIEAWGGTSPSSGLNWQTASFDFIGSGGSQTIRIVTQPTAYAADGRGAMLDNIALTETVPNTGHKNSTFALQNVALDLTDTDGSESITSVTVSNIPVGATLGDGTHSFTATSGHTTADVTVWNGSNVSFTPPTDFVGTIDLAITAVSTEEATGTSASTTKTLRVTVLSATSPIALDLDGNGIQTVALGDTQGVFDLLNTGTPVRSGWLSAGDGFLAVDTNGNGIIDNRNELFGGLVGEGFAKLEQFDSNGDGVVDATDPGFAQLRIWQDLNGNHRTDAGELTFLTDRGVRSISTTYTVRDEEQNGNRLLERSTATMADGRFIDVADVYFPVADAIATVPAATAATAPVPLLTPAPALAAVSEKRIGASVRPGWGEPRDRSSRITVQSRLHIPTAPRRDVSSMSTAARENLATAADARIDWKAALHTSAVPPPRTDVDSHEAQMPWLSEFLGVKRAKDHDFGRATGLRIRLPYR
jgi:hypothetical protein